MKKVVAPFILLSLLMISACETEVDLIGEFKQTPIIYGLLNQKDSIHYVRVNKAFITSENAFDAAKIEGINEYYPDSVQVYLLEMDENGSLLDKVIMDTTTYYTKPGDFNTKKLYYTCLKVLNENNTYQIVVNDLNADSAFAETELVRDFQILVPRPFGSANFISPTGAAQSFKWNPSYYGKKYETSIMFYYKEKRSDMSDSITRYVEWPVGSITVDKPESPPGEKSVPYIPETFFQICENQIPYNDPQEEAKVNGRRPLSVDFIISVAADELNTYIEVNNTSGIVQDRSVFTNVENGIGIFSSRYQKVRQKPLHLESLLRLKDMGLKFE
ncbi:MAG: hypothetical protein K9G58_08555 [Bacteroidales bacterium]|nr:hypothetical protein [Bacteroidales bacterium]MCF8386326.1 hypothetical protein [Bacteroidales bacterium]MCF8398203.1 hypothetical protein [Bacteroidales bacterium]